MNNYLVIYDVRGIQNYIFRTNKLKEITGASIIVRDKLPSLLKELLPAGGYVDAWKNTEFTFFKDLTVSAEIVYVGGGNLLLAYRGSKEDLEDFNKTLQKRFLEETYSLSLAYAAIEMTNDFKADLKNVKVALSNVKKRMPQLVMTPASPIVEIDQYTSNVISNKMLGAEVSKESYLKLKAYESSPNEHGIKFIDSIAGKTERNSSAKTMIGIVHIDGNNLGEMISKFYEGKNATSYEESVKLAREVSSTIEDVFNGVIDDVLKEVDHRVVINSGDDITFICKAEHAIITSQKVINKIEEKKLGNVNFSACGGIVFVHSHFPFFRAYEMAEECCSIAKKKAKLEENKINGRASSFIDYEICDAGILLDIPTLRERYANLYLKPYAVSKALNTSSEYHIESFLNKVKDLQGLSRTTVKQLRNVYQIGQEHATVYYEKIKTRNDYFNHHECYKNGQATLYDASSMIDLIDLEGRA